MFLALIAIDTKKIARITLAINSYKNEVYFNLK